MTTKKKAVKKKTAKKAAAKPAKPRKRFKVIAHECSVREAFGFVSDIESLKDEMSEWRDNMESNGMENVPKFEEVSECADALENIHSEIENACESLEEALDKSTDPALKALLDARVKYIEQQPYGRGAARWIRLDNAVTPMRVAMESIATALDKTNEAHRDACEYADEVSSQLEDCGNVSFPEMF